MSKLTDTHLNDFITDYGKYFGYDAVKNIVCLLISVSNEKLCAPGVTLNELQEILSLYHDVLSGEVSEQCSQNNSQLCDAASLLLLTYSFGKSLTARLGHQYSVRSMDGYFVYKLSIRDKLDVRTMNMITSLLKSYISSEKFGKKKNISPQKLDIVPLHLIYFRLPTYSNDFSKPVENNCDSRILAYDVRYLRHSSFCLLNSKDFREFSYRTVFCLEWLHGKIYALGVQSVLNDLEILIDMLSSLDDKSNSRKAL
ncbi:unnamed protein product [Heterobilharzia americana]|nr:unnamed protein product [Heterobilharzia americana]